jgi:hypothetical protein
VVVNTDADNQYRGRDIARLVEPILAGRADVVVGDRRTDTIEHFSLLKRVLQRWGSRVVRRASGTEVADSTSGFRALSRRAATTLFVHNRFSYTLETIIQAGQAGLVLENVPIETNPQTRTSRLFRSIPEYLRRNGAVIVRAYNMYWPAQTFGVLALALLLLGLGLGGRFLWFLRARPRLQRARAVAVGGRGLGAAGVLGGAHRAARRPHGHQPPAARRRAHPRARLDAALAAGAKHVEGIESTGSRRRGEPPRPSCPRPPERGPA